MTDLILAQAKTGTGKLTYWANTPLGFSKNLIHARGDQLVLLAEILELSPVVVNDRLKEVGAFDGDQILWDKLPLAYPQWEARLVTPYDNAVVLDALSHEHGVIVLTASQAVRYVGGGMCHDPKTGTARPTADFPDVLSLIILSQVLPVVVVPLVPILPAAPLVSVTDHAQAVIKPKKSHHAKPQLLILPVTTLTAQEKKAIHTQLLHVRAAMVALSKMLSL